MSQQLPRHSIGSAGKFFEKQRASGHDVIIWHHAKNVKVRGSR